MPPVFLSPTNVSVNSWHIRASLYIYSHSLGATCEFIIPWTPPSPSCLLLLKLDFLTSPILVGFSSSCTFFFFLSVFLVNSFLSGFITSPACAEASTWKHRDSEPPHQALLQIVLSLPWSPPLILFQLLQSFLLFLIPITFWLLISSLILLSSYPLCSVSGYPWYIILSTPSFLDLWLPTCTLISSSYSIMCWLYEPCCLITPPLFSNPIFQSSPCYPNLLYITLYLLWYNPIWLLCSTSFTVYSLFSITSTLWTLSQSLMLIQLLLDPYPTSAWPPSDSGLWWLSQNHQTYPFTWLDLDQMYYHTQALVLDANLPLLQRQIFWYKSQNTFALAFHIIYMV